MRQTGWAPPGAAPAAWPQEPQLASAIPFQVPQGAVGKHRYQASGEVGRVPPRRPKRRPHPGTSAIQRPSRGRCLLLLVFQAWPAASHPQSPSSGAEQTNPPTPSGIPLTQAAGADVLVTFGSSYESPVTEDQLPARLFRGPRSENRTRYGTVPLDCHDPKAACRRRFLGGLLAAKSSTIPAFHPTTMQVTPQRPFNLTSKEGRARINLFTPRRGPVRAEGRAVQG